jgi:hypothetical protein
MEREIKRGRERDGEREREGVLLRQGQRSPCGFAVDSPANDSKLQRAWPALLSIPGESTARPEKPLRLAVDPPANNASPK